jgi:protein TonB
MSAFAALPDYSFAPVSRKTPIATGKAASTYLSIVYGIVISRIRYPEGAAGHGRTMGEIVFGVDVSGRLVGQRVVKSSGSPELDLAALAAIRAASPFPPPPTGTGISLTLRYHR